MGMLEEEKIVAIKWYVSSQRKGRGVLWLEGKEREPLL